MLIMPAFDMLCDIFKASNFLRKYLYREHFQLNLQVSIADTYTQMKCQIFARCVDCSHPEIVNFVSSFSC